MANLDYSDLLGEVLPYLAADPSDPVTEGAIKRAVIELCTKALVWKHVEFTADVVAGVSAYQITPPTGSTVVGVAEVLYDGRQISAKSFSTLNATKPGWMSTQGDPEAYTQIETDRLILAPVPSSSVVSGLHVTLYLAPEYDASEAPAWILERHRYAIAEGAISRLMMMPGKKWTDLQGGIDRRARFESQIANAANDATVGTASAVIRTTAYH